ncbi:helicase associated domain-containing protein [Kitasatospora sp. NBC_00070]|uniref:helicase associated domain-containing protein n=1 Tax=Kitasatospora sp. NBC_00070 TaxID=2975962 RepID=UPI00324EFECF
MRRRRSSGPRRRRSPWRCPAWPITWQRAYAAARQWWLESDGQVDWAQLPESTLFEGEQLRPWALAQRAGHPGLEAEQQDLLVAIGTEADLELVAAKAAAEAKPRASRSDRFALGVTALAAFVAEHGHVRVPRPHRQRVDGADGEDQAVVEVALGAFLNNAKARRSKLTAGQLAQLAEHGIEWAVP